MNPISAFFVRNIIAVFFFYGLAFFAMGLALLLASRRTSEFTFARRDHPAGDFRHSARAARMGRDVPEDR